MFKLNLISYFISFVTLFLGAAVKDNTTYIIGAICLMLATIIMFIQEGEYQK